MNTAPTPAKDRGNQLARTVLLWPLHSKTRLFMCVVGLIAFASIIGGRTRGHHPVIVQQNPAAVATATSTTRLAPGMDYTPTAAFATTTTVAATAPAIAVYDGQAATP